MKTNTPKERPVLFSGPMVRAILDGRKTQTRRIVKPQPDCALTSLASTTSNRSPRVIAMRGGLYSIFCPYGKPGDRLWVKETFVAWDKSHDGNLITGQLKKRACNFIEYRADESSAELKWRPSIFMPRWASRITLEITALRVERLQQISGEDCRAEGCGSPEIPWRADGAASHPWVDTYKRIWDSINGPESWAANPWVWVVEFRRINANE